MPLLLPQPAPAPVPLPPNARYVTAVTTITDTSGRDWILDGGEDIWLQPGRKGFHAPSYQHYRDESPAVDGAFWRGVRATVRELIVPIVIVAQTRAQLLQLRRGLISAISPRRGECVITTAYPDGSQRSIRARYVDGMEGEEGKGAWGVTRQAYSLRFVADDPFLFGPDISLMWGSGASTRTELPIPGADGAFEVVSAANILGTATVDNPGDVDSFPVWRFNGPFTAITLTNHTSGKSLTLTHTAAAGQWIAIDTTPGQTSIVDQAGTNRWSELTAGYALWPLLDGLNDIELAVTGSDANTTATMTYRPRYEAA